MVRDHQTEVLNGAAKGVVATGDGSPEEVLLQLRVSPRPAVLRADGAPSVEGNRATICRRCGIRCDVGIVPVRLAREQPDASVVGRRILLRLDVTIAGCRVVYAALDEVLHALVVLKVPDRAVGPE